MLFFFFLTQPQSFYEDTSIPSLTSPETDKWLGEVLPPDFNNNQDFSVPELFMLGDVSSLPDMFDDTGSDEEVLSILDEIIMKDEKKTEGKQNLAITTREQLHHAITPQSFHLCVIFFIKVLTDFWRIVYGSTE